MRKNNHTSGGAWEWVGCYSTEVPLFSVSLQFTDMVYTDMTKLRKLFVGATSILTGKLWQQMKHQSCPYCLE